MGLLLWCAVLLSAQISRLTTHSTHLRATLNKNRVLVVTAVMAQLLVSIDTEQKLGEARFDHGETHLP